MQLWGVILLVAGVWLGARSCTATNQVHDDHDDDDHDHDHDHDHDEEAVSLQEHLP